MTAALLLIVALATVWPAPQGHDVQFQPVIEESGIDFVHENGASHLKFMPETMGSGVLVFDYDKDGWPDVLFVNGGSFVDEEVSASARHRLYRNASSESGRLQFMDVSPASGIGPSAFGMGACAADYDNDGWDDVYITSVGSNSLYRNNGDGTFSDVSRSAGVESDRWSASCAFGDIDDDGHLDLYVSNYVDFAVDNNKYCGDIQNVRFYCHPHIYNAQADVLFRNNGDGTFQDISVAGGVEEVEGKGLGLVFLDYDGDGWLDLYVANDSTPNFLLRNRGDGSFEDAALWAGVAVGLDGSPLAGMGTDAGDLNGDGLPDLIVTNLDRQTHSFYRNLGNGLFADETYESGIGESTLPYVGFGAVLFDYDNDSDLDVAIANGDVLDNVQILNDSATYPQLNLLLENDGSARFTEVGRSMVGFSLEKVSRGMAVGDLDNDGDLDLLVTNNGQPPDVLRNEGGNRNNSLEVHVIGVDSNRSGIGTRLRLTLGERTLVRTVKAGSSYLGQNDRRVHFGMGASARGEQLEILWPSGAVDVLKDVEANRILTIREGGAIVSSMEYAR